MDLNSLEKAKPFYEQIYETIKNLIIQGEYEPGERVYEAKIAKEFNISRSPVREAVRALVKEGLLVLNEKSQLEVYKPSIEDVEQIYQCRSTLESLAVELCTVHATDEQVTEIEEILANAKNAIDNPNKDKMEVISMNALFHDRLVELSGNKWLAKLLQDLKSLTNFYRYRNFEGENRKEAIYKEHYEIFTFVKERNSKKAATAMASHIMNDLDYLKQIFISKNK
jgi:DNA-binding GntR family transcriptional regulator